METPEVAAPMTAHKLLIATLSNLVANEKVYGVSAPTTVTMLYPGNQYRKKPLEGSEEFFFAGARIGKNDKIIVELKPCDARPYEQIEFPLFEVGKTIPGIADDMAEVLGYGAVSLPTAVKKFTKKFEEETQAEVAATETNKYENNPQWGMF